MKDPYYFSYERKELRERVYNMIDKWHCGWKGVHRFDELREQVMRVINHYLTNNLDLAFKRDAEYHNSGVVRGSIGTKNYNINRIKFFKDIPDGIEVLVNYVDVTAIRTMNIPTEIVYESIYRELPELFEE